MTSAILLASRAGGRYLACLIIGCLAGVLFSPYGLKIRFAPQHPAVVMGVAELCAVVLICVGVIVLRPRLWIIDRLGTPGRRWIPATGAALAVVGSPQLVLGLAAGAALRQDTWALSATTALFLAGVAVLVAPFLGALRAGGLTLLLYFVLTVTAQLATVIGTWSPLTVVTWPMVVPPSPIKIAVAVACTCAAIAVTFRTLGRTMRTWGQDLDTA